MHHLLSSSFFLGSLQLTNRLIQGPLAGFSCAPFRELFYQFTPPAYCVTEMISAHDVVHKHTLRSRYLYRSSKEQKLCYQIAGHEPAIMAQAAVCLEQTGADLIDINCGCPKTKIRKKGAGSALLENPEQLFNIINAVRQAISIPLTVKIRIDGTTDDFNRAKMIEDAGADALIVHGRHWTESYDPPCNLEQVAQIKHLLTIPVIANGDISDCLSLNNVLMKTGCDAYMISRAGTGKPWLYHHLIHEGEKTITLAQQISLFMQHVQGLASLENHYKAVLQSKSLVRFYFKNQLDKSDLYDFYQLNCLNAIENFLLTKVIQNT
ncbi:tRNA dihydrouridine synthase [Legionella fairfieldensis]|uniref:tRNA dihydrouridine synthase n=1 Tax=Legionella fairfieldensis TaxID=45064 RepID=UPI00048AE59F|nr:tRNA-dihydrouridine synthase family protein [Legionella fairfieldensis]